MRLARVAARLYLAFAVLSALLMLNSAAAGEPGLAIINAVCVPLHWAIAKRFDALARQGPNT